MTDQEIGTVFTSPRWAKFVIERFSIFDHWLAGKTVFDPTMGNGQLLISLVEYGLDNGYELDDLPLNRLFGNEINTRYYQEVIAHFQSNYNFDLTNQITNSELLELQPKQFDIIFGNPPWQNFVDLPEEYKPFIKSKMDEFGLIKNKKNLLLGSSRIDLSALIIQCSMSDFLKSNGDAYFFLPLSLFLNDGAHEQFRKFEVKDSFFGLISIIDLANTDAFHSVNTRHGVAHFTKDKKTSYPIPYYVFEDNSAQKNLAGPLYNPFGPLSISKKLEYFQNPTFIDIEKSAQPRQGINTSGANSVFIFNDVKKISEDLVLIENTHELPSKFIFPLLTNENFDSNSTEATKWVLLPYHSNGKVLTLSELDEFPQLKSYLEIHEVKLKNRKGRLIQTMIQKGIWWSLLGVGPYSFAKYKIVWRAYGRKKFDPILVEGNWQANQSLQAFMSFSNKKNAQKILSKLQKPEIEAYLKSLHMDGTMNWAQPGKIKSFLKFR